MPRKVKVYVGAVIAAGSIVLATALMQWAMASGKEFLVYLAAACITSVIKIRLPGMTGTYSLNFIFILVGVAHFSLPETLIVGAAAALLQSVCFTKRRPTPVQIAFNMANLVLSGGLSFFLAHSVLSSGFQTYRYAVLAAVVTVYFVTNTVLVSGVLHLLEGKPLSELCREWYVWSFPYYLVGAVLVGMLPLSGHTVSAESCLLLLPLLYLVHFFCGLSMRRIPAFGDSEPDHGDGSLPAPAKVYVTVVIAAGLALLAYATLQLSVGNAARALSYLALAVVGSTYKVRLPRMRGTISVAFVLLLVAIEELSFPEAIILSGIMALVQCLWKPKDRPQAMQVCFSTAGLMLSTGLAYALCRSDVAPDWTSILPLTLALATTVLYFTNTILVSTAVCLVENRPAETIWQQCYFWSFPYYLVGAAAAGVMVLTSRTAGWLPAMLVLPVMGLVYVSYEVQVHRATQS